MKHVKMLGLAVAAAAALMAFVGVGTASAYTVLCSAQESPCSVGNKWANGNLTFSQSSSTLLKETGASGETLDTCKKSSVTGSVTNGTTDEIEKEGKKEVIEINANGAISSLLWEECTWTTTTIAKGGLEVVSAGSHNGTVKANAEIKVTISIPFFGSCVYGVKAGTAVGTITEGKPATFDANAVAEKLSGSSITCPSTSNWSGGYTQTIPKETTLSVETN